MHASMKSPVQPNFTRGIINPNYPGFQHLAHTLSEHFTDHHFEHSSSDSDASEEFDVDVANDFDDNNNNNNNNNDDDAMDDESNAFRDNGNVEMHNEQPVSHISEESNKNLLQKLEPKIYCEKNIEIKLSNNQMLSSSSSQMVDEEIVGVVNGASPTSEESDCEQILEHHDDKAQFVEKNDGLESISCNLETYLKQFETPNDLTCLNDEEHFDGTSDDIKYDDYEQIMLTQPTVTPDILLKNDSMSDVNTNPSNGDENSLGFKPDLLSNISNQIDPSNTSPSLLPTSLTLTSSATQSSVLLSSKQSSLEITPPQTLEALTTVLPSTQIQINVLNDEYKTENIEKSIQNNDDDNDIKTDSIIQPPTTFQQVSPPTTLYTIPSNPENFLNTFNTITTVTSLNLKKSPLNDYSIRSTTPIDIVGDFGREIEREIGLIVSGYNQIKIDDYHCVNDDSNHENDCNLSINDDNRGDENVERHVDDYEDDDGNVKFGNVHDAEKKMNVKFLDNVSEDECGIVAMTIDKEKVSQLVSFILLYVLCFIVCLLECLLYSFNLMWFMLN